MKRKYLLIFFLITSSLLTANIKPDDDKLKAFRESVSEESIGNYKKAIEVINNHYNKNKNDYLVNLRLGWLYYLSKDYEKSISFYNEAVRLSANSAEALLGLTYPLSAMNKWGEIEKIYKKILDKDKHNYSANLLLGQIYLNNGSYLNAKVLLENLSSNYPGDYEVNLYLGWTYYYLGNKSKANQLFTNALIQNSGSASAIEGLNLTR